MVAPSVSPSAAASTAIELYDVDGDSVLSEDEVQNCPAMKMNFAVYDANANGSLDEAEIEARIHGLTRHRIALFPLTAKVTLDRRPLAGAEVVLEPEPYLGESVRPARGTTRNNGVAKLAVAADELPEAQQGIEATHVGSFKVRITHPESDVPAKYNVQTELGYETVLGSPSVDFNLTTK